MFPALPYRMSTDQSENRTSGETEGVDQQPTEAGDSDATQREQADREGATPSHDPSKPKAETVAGTGSAEGKPTI